MHVFLCYAYFIRYAFFNRCECISLLSLFYFYAASFRLESLLWDKSRIGKLTDGVPFEQFTIHSV